MKKFNQTAPHVLWGLTRNINSKIEQLKSLAGTVNENEWRNLWNFAKTGIDEEISLDDIYITLETLESPKIRSFYQELDEKKGGWTKFTEAVDSDDSGSFDQDEFEIVLSAIAIAFELLVMGMGSAILRNIMRALCFTFDCIT